MRRLLPWIAFCAFVAIAVLAANTVTTSTAPIKIMPLGDSITDGGTIPGGYRIDLEDALVADGVGVDFVGSLQNGLISLADPNHEGHSGWRIDQIAGSVDSWLTTYRPEIVLLMIGTNDIVQDYQLATAQGRFGALLDRIHAAEPETYVLVSSIPPLADATDDQQARTLNAAISQLVKTRADAGKPIGFVDIYATMTTNDLLADGVHPNTGGYSKIANAWYSALSPILNNNAATVSLAQSCVGMQVSAGANLTSVAASAPAGTTFCLAAGSYTVAQKVISQPGDVFSGQGPASTIITAAPGCCAPMFDYDGGEDGVVTFNHLAVGGANTPVTTHCTAGSCGSVMLSIVAVHMADVRCFGNATSCLSGGTHDIVLSNFECDGNGWHPDSLANAFQSSSCIKLGRSAGTLTVTSSNFHDNTWDAIWCDYCRDVFLNVQSSRFIHNGRAGITWEVSGNFVAGDHALIRNNIIQNNGWNINTSYGSGGHAGIIISDASNMEITGNTFGGNLAGDSPGNRAVFIYDGTRDPAPIYGISIHDNTLNGNRIQSCFTGVSCSANLP